MNRKEKIERAAWNFAPMPYNEGKDWDEVKSANLRAGFKEGHEQGYKDAIEKACEYFNKRMWEMNSPDDDTTYVVDGVSSSISEFIRNFKEYMEEQL